MTAADLARLDVPLTDLVTAADRMTDVKAKRLAAGLAAEAHHLMDPMDHAFEAIPLAHPELIPDSDWTPGRPA